MINRKFIHFEKYESFRERKISASPDNTSYTLGGYGEIIQGEPDISWQSIVYIKDSKFICTHGQIYDASGIAEKLKESVKINGTDFDASEDIITSLWGTSREIIISDGTNDSDPVSVDGGDDITLYLPENIDANVTKDSEGNVITDTYSTKQELIDAFDELDSFLVFSGDTDEPPTLNSYPSSEWVTVEDKNIHSGDYYITTSGRIFQFVEEPVGTWYWKEITDYYLYQCLEELSYIKDKVDVSTKWDTTQTIVDIGSINVNGSEGSNPYLDVICCPQFVNYSLQYDTNLYLPFVYGGVYIRTLTNFSSRDPRLITTDDLSRIVGKTIVIKNQPDSVGTITLFPGNSPETPHRTITLNPGKICILEMKASILLGAIVYYWEVTEAVPNPTINW